MKKLSVILLALLLASAVHATGNPPTPSNGPGLVDGTWLNGLAGGQNELYQNAIAAAGSTQATATQLPAGIALLEIDSGSGGVALPFCIQGTEFSVYNNTSGSITAYPNNTNNSAVSPAAQDTINNSTTFSMSGHTPYFFTCAKNGVWAAK